MLNDALEFNAHNLIVYNDNDDKNFFDNIQFHLFSHVIIHPCNDTNN